MSLALGLRLGRAHIDGDPAAAAALIDQAIADLAERRRSCASWRGASTPPPSTDGGLRRRCSAGGALDVPVRLVAVPPALAARGRGAAYFMVAEALTNAARYAGAARPSCASR